MKRRKWKGEGRTEEGEWKMEDGRRRMEKGKTGTERVPILRSPFSSNERSE